MTVDRGAGREGSLMVTVYGDGSARFSVRYTRPSGARVFLPLGKYGDAGLSLAEACDKHDEAMKLLAKDTDPIEEFERRDIEAERTRVERAGADTVEDLVNRFVRDQLASRKRPEAAETLRPGQCRSRHPSHPALARASQHCAHGALHRARAGSVQGFLARLAVVRALNWRS